jgi:hypothetical protein
MLGFFARQGRCHHGAMACCSLLVLPVLDQPRAETFAAVLLEHEQHVHEGDLVPEEAPPDPSQDGLVFQGNDDSTGLDDPVEFVSVNVKIRLDEKRHIPVVRHATVDRHGRTMTQVACDPCPHLGIVGRAPRSSASADSGRSGWPSQWSPGLTWGIGLAQSGFGRTGVEARSQGYWSGVHQPLLPVDEFANRVEVPGVAGGLSDRMEQDIPNIVQAPLTLGKGPPDQVGIWG